MGFRSILVAAGLLAGVPVANADVFAVNRTSSYSFHQLVRFSDTGQYLGSLGAVGLETAHGIAIGPDGYVYVSGHGLGVGTITGLHGQGTGPSRTFEVNTPVDMSAVIYTQPGGMAVGPDGDLYATSTAFTYGGAPNSKSGLLRFSTTTGKYVSTVFRPANDATFSSDVVFGPDGRAYVATEAGIYRTTAGSTAGELFIDSSASQIAFGPDGDLYALSNVLRQYDGRTGELVRLVIPKPVDPDLRITYFDFGPTGELLATLGSYATYNFLDSIYRYDITTGTMLGTFTGLPGGHLSAIAVNNVPEPTLTLLSVASAGLLCRRRRRIL